MPHLRKTGYKTCEPHGHGGAWKTGKVSVTDCHAYRGSRMKRFASVFDRDQQTLIRQQPSTQGAVFHCIGGRDYRRLAYYFR